MTKIEKYIQKSQLAADTETAAYWAAKAYNAAKQKVDEYKALQNQAKSQALDVLEENEYQPVDTEAGKLTYVHPGVTLRYDAKGLDSVALALPDVAAIIAPFRKEGVRQGYVLVK